MQFSLVYNIGFTKNSFINDCSRKKITQIPNGRTKFLTKNIKLTKVDGTVCTLANKFVYGLFQRWISEATSTLSQLILKMYILTIAQGLGWFIIFNTNSEVKSPNSLWIMIKYVNLLIKFVYIYVVYTVHILTWRTLSNWLNLEIPKLVPKQILSENEWNLKKTTSN